MALNFKPNMSDASQDSLYKARGSSSQFEAGKYDIASLQYPADLMSEENGKNKYGSNYVIFYINVSEDSKLIRPGAERVDTVANITPRDRGDLIGQAVEQNFGADTLYGTNVGAALLTTKLFGEDDKAIKALKAGGAAVLTSAAIQQQASNFQAKTQRLKTAIALHMPNVMNTRYSVSYDEASTMKESMALGVVAGTINMTKAAIKALDTGGVGAEIMDSFEAGRGGVAAVGLSMPGQGVAQKITGLAPNPRKEQLFKQVDFRTFQFTYEFFPRNKQESQQVKNIIDQFKYHMHPEYKDQMNFLYVYPSEFDIFYYHGTQENLNVNRHTSCVLTEMNINYSPQGQFTAFDDGTPTQINVVLTFKELATLTKEKIEDGL